MLRFGRSSRNFRARSSRDSVGATQGHVWSGSDTIWLLNRYDDTASVRGTSDSGTSIRWQALFWNHTRMGLATVSRNAERDRAKHSDCRRPLHRCGTRRRRWPPDSAEKTTCFSDRADGAGRWIRMLQNFDEEETGPGWHPHCRMRRPKTKISNPFSRVMSIDARDWQRLHRKTVVNPAMDRDGRTLIHPRISLKTRAVVPCSRERWNCVARFAGVKWTRPSEVSVLGETVAAFAAHIADADPHDARSHGNALAAFNTWVSVPENPSALA